MSHSPKKTAFGYLVFSGSSTFLAFLLPVFFWKMTHNNDYFGLHIIIQYLLINLLLFAMLFQGQYRLKTTVTDLGLKKADFWKKLIRISFYLSLLALLGMNIAVVGELSSSL